MGCFLGTVIHYGAPLFAYSSAQFYFWGGDRGKRGGLGFWPFFGGGGGGRMYVGRSVWPHWTGPNYHSSFFPPLAPFHSAKSNKLGPPRAAVKAK